MLVGLVVDDDDDDDLIIIENLTRGEETSRAQCIAGWPALNAQSPALGCRASTAEADLHVWLCL